MVDSLVSSASDRSEDLATISTKEGEVATTTTTTLAAVYRSRMRTRADRLAPTCPVDQSHPGNPVCPSTDCPLCPSPNSQPRSRLLNPLPPPPPLNFSAGRRPGSIHGSRIISPSASSGRLWWRPAVPTVTSVPAIPVPEPSFLHVSRRLPSGNSTRRTNNRYRRG